MTGKFDLKKNIEISVCCAILKGFISFHAMR